MRWLIDSTPREESFAAAVAAGLAGRPKAIPCRFLYDEIGSKLFEEICELPEYYLTRAEREILVAQADRIATRFAGPITLAELGSGSAAENPLIQRQLGFVDFRLQTAWWSLVGALNELGDDYQPNDPAINRLQLAKRHVVTAAVEIVDQAMELVGGASYFRGSPLERAYRDVRAGTYHPFTPEKSLLYAGRLALELPVDEIW